MKTQDELNKSGEIHGSEYDRRRNPTIAELEAAIATGKHVDLKPDGTATISDKKPRPTIDQVLTEVGGKHNQPVERMAAIKQFWHPVSEKPASRGCYLCRMKEDESIVYQDLKYDDGWYGQGYRTITHWAQIPMILRKE